MMRAPGDKILVDDKKVWLYGRGKSRYNKARFRVMSIFHILHKMGISEFRPNFNPMACFLIETYGKDNGYNFQHALNGGEHYIAELGYWVDGYDKEKNVVIEIDELHHFDDNGKLCRKDIIRQKRIEKLLKCKFIRLRI